MPTHAITITVPDGEYLYVLHADAELWTMGSTWGPSLSDRQMAILERCEILTAFLRVA